MNLIFVVAWDDLHCKSVAFPLSGDWNSWNKVHFFMIFQHYFMIVFEHEWGVSHQISPILGFVTARGGAATCGHMWVRLPGPCLYKKLGQPAA